MHNRIKIFAVLMMAALLMAACGKANQPNKVSYTLRSELQDGKMLYVGVGDGIEGVVNPTLVVSVGSIVEVKLVSGDGTQHNISFPDFSTTSENVSGKGNSVSVIFGADRPGKFPYFCNLPGHREAGMEGELDVEGGASSAPAAADYGATPTAGMDMSTAPAAGSSAGAAPATGVNVVRDPTDLPGPLASRGPTTVRLDLETSEVVGQLADGTTFPYWTFNGKVPGPFFRIRVGDTVEVHLKNDATSIMPHSVDFHAVTGPGGGAVFTSTAPGGETTFNFMALNPGLFVYHCATPMVAEHIANGMYGLILVEPEGGLAKVDREFYMMQGEIYTSGSFGDKGAQTVDITKLLNETPEYYVFNGMAGALTASPLKANVGETIRIFFGVGGPNKISSFHLIGEIFDRVFDQASLTSPALTDVQTTLVPPGGATVVELKFQVPGRYILVDHALSRLQRGLAGFIMVDGPPAPEIFNGTPMPGSGH